MRDALFLHIQKTAGTSVHAMAHGVYGKENTISHADYQKLGVDGCRKKAFVSGHFGHVFASQLMEGRYSFTFLRDPVDRLISMYGYCRSHQDTTSVVFDAAKKLDLYEFLGRADQTEFREMLWNHQVWQLGYGWGADINTRPWLTINNFGEDDLLEIAKQNLLRFQYVGFVETFSTDIRKIFADLGVNRIGIPKENRAAQRTTQADLPPKTIKRLLELTELDRA
ncbi:MAG: sulfotransferase family 2 domain-containing protein [Albidovulum sp.]